jgi:putative membrane protein
MNPPDDVDAGWRALPATAIAALYVSGIQQFVRQNLLAFAGAGTGIAISDALGWREFTGIALLVLLGGLLIALVYHRRFRYRVDEEAVRVRQGLFERVELKVRLERVQNVGFSQPIYLRPLALTRVSLETPGAAMTEVRLPGIRSDEARALRDLVNGARAGASGTDVVDGARRDSREADAAPAPDGRVVFRAGSAALFRYGLTSNQTWILLAVVGPLVGDRVRDRIEEAVEFLSDAGVIGAGQFGEAPLLGALLVVAAVVAIGATLLALSGMLTIVRFHGYVLTEDDERLRAGFGLLDARETTLAKPKLHSFELVQTGMGRLVRSWHAVGHQTGSGDALQPDGGDRRFLVPGITRDSLSAVAGSLAGRPWTVPDVKGIDRRFRTRSWVRICGPLLVVAALLAWAGDASAHLPALVLTSTAAALALAIHLRWRKWGWALEGDRLTVRKGLLGQSWIAFDLDRCQQVRVTTSPYQRRHGLATLVIRLPHGEQPVPYLPRQDADRMVNRLLYEVERSMQHAL